MPDQKPDVALYEVFAEERHDLQRIWPDDLEGRFFPGTIQEEGHTEPRARILTTRTQSLIPQTWCEQLDAVLTRSTGFDHLQHLAGHGVQLGYLPQYCARSVAEHAMLVWSALLKKLPAQVRQFSLFKRDGITGRELSGKKLLVIGVGNIGSEIYRLAQALGMQVHGLDIEKKFADINYVDATADVSYYDIIVSAMNLTADNAGYFDQAFFDRVKRGCIFINISRGELSPHAILKHNLENGRLGGVGLDVFDNEKEIATGLRHKSCITDDAQLLLDISEHTNVILTPHNAFNTEEATQRKAEQTIRQLRAYMDNAAFIWRV
ncbi:MAG: hypothetical protein MI673_02170 [Thiotrichales bacterium]|nr:hypothetical protein [Thiotrichales bacterium]